MAEAWTEVARLRRLALLAAREAVERRRLADSSAGDPFHPRSQGLAAAADFHGLRARQAAERARGAADLAAEMETHLELARRAARCA